MKNLVLCCALALAGSAQAQEWKGIGEFGLAITGGNTDTTNINGKLGLTKESDAWKHEFGLGVLKASAKQVVVDLANATVIRERTVKTAQRYDAAWTSGYKLSDTSYVYGNLRYENDQFGSFRNQTIAGLGYGFYAIKDEPTTLLFEIGAGYRRSQKQDGFVPQSSPCSTPGFSGAVCTNLVATRFRKEGDAILRGKIDFSHKLTETAALYDTFLLEAGSNNKYYQNDLGLALKVSDAFAVKTGFQIRYNSDATKPVGKTDRLFTTNLVYSF